MRPEFRRLMNQRVTLYQPVSSEVNRTPDYTAVALHEPASIQPYRSRLAHVLATGEIAVEKELIILQQRVYNGVELAHPWRLQDEEDGRWFEIDTCEFWPDPDTGQFHHTEAICSRVTVGEEF